MTIQELNMTANTPEKQMLLDHLTKNATEELAAKIKEGGKTLDGAWKFVMSYAKSKIDPKKRSGSVGVYVPPDEVFGMMMHYFEDEKEGAEYRTEAEKQDEEKRKQDEMERERKRLEAMTPEQIEAERIERERREQERKEKLAEEEERRRKREAAEAEKRAKEEARRVAEKAQMTLF